MSARLKDRQMSVPNGYIYQQKETGWRPRKNSSFASVVQQLIHHRQGNAGMAAKHGWATDQLTVEMEVDEFNAKHCVAMGWDKYVSFTGEDGPSPKTFPPGARSGPSAAGVSHFVGGGKALLEMFGPEQKPVATALAASRAAICIKCPMNDKGDWKAHFTEPASKVILKMIGIVHDLNLTTPHDNELRVCSVCFCPLKTKVWAPLYHIRAHLKPGMQAQLPAHCWIATE